MANSKIQKKSSGSKRQKKKSPASKKPVNNRKRKRRTSTASSIPLNKLFPEFVREAYDERLKESNRGFVEDLNRAYIQKGLVLYLGAGLSMSINLPSWNELIRMMTITMKTSRVKSAASEMAKLRDSEQSQAIQNLVETIEKQTELDKPNLMMARALKTQLKDDLPSQVAYHLYRKLPGKKAGFRFINKLLGFNFVDNLEELGLPTSPLMKGIVGLARPQRDIKGVQAIVNYNYDDILDETLRKDKVRCVTVRSGRDKIPQSSLPCYHVHGVLPTQFFNKDRSRTSMRNTNVGNFVFSEDEYHLEYSDPYRWSNMTQMSLMGRHTGLFVGLSMQDPNLRRLIDVTHMQYPEIVNYAILPRSTPPKASDHQALILRNLGEEMETESFREIGVHVIWVDSYEEIPETINQVSEIR